jgi:hypothetical protein
MNYFDACGIYQDIAVNLQYCESLGQKQSEVFIEWVNKYGIEKIKDCFNALDSELEKKREHYAQMLKIAINVNKMMG